MATIESTLKLNDQMSSALSSITTAMDSTLAAMRGIKGIDLGPEFAQAAADIKLAEKAVGDLGAEMNSVPDATSAAGDGFTVFKGVAVSAISAVASSVKNELSQALDAALTRIDTMEQFERTMTVLAGSASAADDALASVTATVTGTAYGLDVAASAVQDFVTSGMEVDSATAHIEGLANAVSFYGDGTNATLESVTRAWANMSTSGQVYSTDVRTLLLAGIPVWDMYAEAVGMSVAEVQTATSSGAISAQEFQDTLIAAMETGTESFPGIANAAQEAGASWAGTFDNMSAATARGVMAIVESIDSGLIAAGMNPMRESLLDAAKGFESLLTAMGSVTELIISKLGPVLVPLAGVIAGVTLAWGAYTAGVKLATVATGALKGAMDFLTAHPAIAAIGALVGIVAAASVAFSDADDSVSAFNKTLKESEKAREAAWGEIEQNEQDLQNMVGTVLALTDAWDGSAYATAAVEEAVAQLNAAVPDLELEFDALTGTLNMTEEALMDVVDAMIAQEKQEQAIADAVEIGKEMLETEEKLLAKQLELNEATEEYERLLNDPDVNGTALENALDKVRWLTEDVENLTEAYEGQGESLAALGDVYAACADAADDFIGPMQKAVDDLIVGTEVLSELQADVLGEMAEQYTKLADQAQDMWKRINTESSLSLAEMTENLEENAKATREWGENVEKIAQQAVPDGLVAYLETGTEDAIQLAALLAEATPDELAAFVMAYEDAGESAIDGMVSALDTDEEVVRAAADLAKSTGESLRSAVEEADFEGAGADVVAGYVQGILDEQDAATDAARTTAANTIEAAEAELGINSPSKVFMDIGMNTILGLAEGITGNESAAVSATQNVVDAVKAAADALDLYPSGVSAMQGFVNGLNAMAPTVAATAQRIANSVKSTIDSALQINSPAKVIIPSGEAVGEALAVGMDNQLGQVEAAAHRSADAVSCALTGSALPTVAAPLAAEALNIEPPGPVIVAAELRIADLVVPLPVISDPVAVQASLGVVDPPAVDPVVIAAAVVASGLDNLSIPPLTIEAPELDPVEAHPYGGELRSFDADGVRANVGGETRTTYHNSTSPTINIEHITVTNEVDEDRLVNKLADALEKMASASLTVGP